MAGDASIVIQGDRCGKGAADVCRSREPNIAGIFLWKRLDPGQEYRTVARNGNLGPAFTIEEDVLWFGRNENWRGKSFSIIFGPGNMQLLIFHLCQPKPSVVIQGDTYRERGLRGTHAGMVRVVLALAGRMLLAGRRDR